MELEPLSLPDTSWRLRHSKPDVALFHVDVESPLSAAAAAAAAVTTVSAVVFSFAREVLVCAYYTAAAAGSFGAIVVASAAPVLEQFESATLRKIKP